MGFGESFSDFLQRFIRPRTRKPPKLEVLEAFAAERKGVEGYVEPRTATNPTTLLLVDRDGDHARSEVKDRDAAVAFCERFGIPAYDAQVIGYPKRMRDFQSRRGRSQEDIDRQFEELEKRLQEPGPPETPDR